MLTLSLLLTLALPAQDWPRFRGPNGAGTSDGKPLPVKFSPTENMAWKAVVPFGQSSPIVAAGRVFVTAKENGKLVTIAHDAASGRQLWRKELAPRHSHEIYRSNDPASATPAAAGNSIYVFFPDFGLVSYALDGKERWRHPLGPFQSFYGMASSPIVAGDLVILICDQTRGSFLLALDKNTGKQRWRTERREHKEGWSVPIVHDGQLIAIGSTRLDSYHLTTGESRWWMPLSSNGAMGTPLIHGDKLVLSTDGSNEPWLPGFAAVLEKLDKNHDRKVSAEEAKNEKDWFEHFGWVDRNDDKLLEDAEWNEARNLGVGQFGAFSVSLNGKGKLEPSAAHWRFQRNIPYIPAPLLYNNTFFMVKSGGIVTALDPATGKLLKQGRSQAAPGDYFASPVAGDGKIFMVSNEGKLSVLKAAPEWEVLSVNDLGEETFATPAIADGRLFVRTRGSLYCFSTERK
ncbi:MAG: PQQ-binding-like beta-propeller repeat protein [Bryobacterales bacterium]|nr:PQQ-binding-like beta-propeller repeat protein [Bryobacterales bacterium]